MSTVRLCLTHRNVTLTFNLKGFLIELMKENALIGFNGWHWCNVRVPSFLIISKTVLLHAYCPKWLYRGFHTLTPDDIPYKENLASSSLF